jgi:hypothetical protein
LNVNEKSTSPQSAPPLPDTGRAKHATRNLWFKIVGGVVVVGCVLFAVAVDYLVRHAEPILRASVIDTLSARFHSPVELDSLNLSLAHGLEVRGSGLRILYLAGPTQPGLSEVTGKKAVPMLSVNQFTFRISLHDLRNMNTHVARVTVQGLELHIPPHSIHGVMTPSGPQQVAKSPHTSLTVGRIECTDAKIFIETTKPGKEPLEFDIKDLELTDAGIDQPMFYTANVINPKPVGNVRAFGHFGPWQGSDPRSTPIDGHYTFEHADLGSIKGIGGILSSTGEYSGQLGHITIDGTTNTPDFSLDVSNHPLPLFTTFHAFVDGTTGDTTLTNVQAKLLHSEFTTAGTVMRVPGPDGTLGHDIALTVDMPHGRMEEMLILGMKTDPPVMRGVLAMKASLHIPPGDVRVPQKLQLAGNLKIDSVVFSNPKLQDRIDGLSMRAQGKPKEVNAAGSDRKAEVASQMLVNFSLSNAMMTANTLDYEIPGAKVLLTGVYSLDGNIFEFKGHVRTDATASQMLTGWKSALVKPFDGFFKKGGAGVQLPIEVSGTKGDVKFGLAMHDANESTQDMASDVKAKRAAHSPAPH